MTVYVVILRGRRPNLQALGKASELVKEVIRPIIEVVARPTDAHINDVVNRLVGQVDEFDAHIGIDLAFDTRPLAPRFGESGAREALRILADEFDAYSFRPVIHTDDPPEDLDEVRHAAAEQHKGVCLRVAEPFACKLSDSRILLDQLHAVGESAGRADVVLDCGHVCSAADTCAGVAGPLLHLREHDWQVTVAAGSFPPPPPKPFIPARQPRVSRIPRLEADLWTQVRERWPEVGYGDYGVDYPGGAPVDDGARPDPNLRYTTGQQWSVYAWPKEGGKHTSFFKLCNALVGSPDWPSAGPDFSWGDREIARAARGDGGPGGGSQWKAYSLSHHLAAVVDSLNGARTE
ncbi:hypothetical protein ACGFNP_43460 [Nonomuraea sp. NPDC049269]|uniref:beta family protein n=1 Tax=Nonomuraea sp. NPDC049269 TaxID=3364349 RepID=UPI0037203ECF